MRVFLKCDKNRMTHDVSKGRHSTCKSFLNGWGIGNCSFWLWKLEEKTFTYQMQFCMRSKWSCLWETFKNGVMWHPDNIKLMCRYLIVNIRSPNVKPVLMKNKRSPTHEEINLHFVNMLSRLDALIAGFYLYIYKLFFLLDARQSFMYLHSNLCLVHCCGFQMYSHTGHKKDKLKMLTR